MDDDVKIKARIEVSEKTYKIWITSLLDCDLAMFSGGFSSIDDGLIELGRNYKKIIGLKKNQEKKIEEGSINMLDFHNWFWIDLLPMNEKYSFEVPKYTNSKELTIKDRLKDIPVKNKEYKITSISQVAQEVLLVRFIYQESEFVLEIHKSGELVLEGDKSANKIVDDIAANIKFDEWSAKMIKND